MNPNLVVGGIFVVIIGVAAYKTIKSMRSNTCPGCSGGCSAKQKAKCKH